MKTLLFSLLLILCFSLPIITEDDNSALLGRAKRGVGVAVATAAKRITFKTFVDFAMASLEVIPVVGDILSSTNDDDKAQELLNQIKANVDNLLQEVNKISNKIDIERFREDVAKITKETHSCFEDLKQYNSDRDDNTKKSLLICTKTIAADVRDILRIAEGTPRTVRPKSLFQTLYEQNGKCEGTVLLPVYSFLLEEYVLGCTVLMNGAKLEFPDENGYVRECQRGVHTFLSTMKTISSFCANKTCETHNKQIKDVFQKSNNNMTTFLRNAPTEMFWFEFVLKKANEDCEAVKDGVDTIPNELVKDGTHIFFAPISNKGIEQLRNLTTYNDDLNDTCFEIRDRSTDDEFMCDSSTLQCTWGCKNNEMELTTLYTNVKTLSCRKILRCCSKSLVRNTRQKCSYTFDASYGFKPNLNWKILGFSLLFLFGFVLKTN